MSQDYLSYYRKLPPGSGAAEPGPCIYEIRVKGCLDGSWSEWFDDLLITANNELGETVMRGPLADQAALHGLLTKVRDLGLALLEVKRVEAKRVKGV